MKYVYEIDGVWEFMRHNADKIDSFKITSIKQIAFGEWDGATYYVNVKLTTIDGYKNKMFTVEVNSHWWDWNADPENQDEALADTVFNYLEPSLYTYN